MTDFKILCPACMSILSRKKPIPNGKKLTCPNCQKQFVAATSVAASPVAAGATSSNPVPAKSEAVKTATSPSASAKSAAAPIGTGPTGTLSSVEFEFVETVPFPPPAETSGPEPSVPATIPAPSPEVSAKIRAPLVRWTLMAGLLVLASVGSGLGVYVYMRWLDAPTVATQAKKIDAKPVVVAASKMKSENTDGNTPPPKETTTSASHAKPAEPEQLLAKGRKGDRAKPAVAAAKVAAPPQWAEYKSVTGGFAVQFPGKPDERLEREADVIHYDTKAEAGGAEYHVTFHRLKRDELKTPAKQRLARIADQFKTVLDKKEITLAGQPALELQLAPGDMKTLAFRRWVVYKEHLFQIWVAGDKERLGPDQVTRFLESFRFVADPKGEFLDLTKASKIPEKK